MMNSYEFDQPLDLRLKALNLSLSPYQKNYSPALAASDITSSRNSANGSCGNISMINSNNDKSPNYNYCSNPSLTNSSSNSNSQISLAPAAPTPISNPIPFAMNPAYVALQNHSTHNSINLQQNHNQHQHQHHHNHQPHRLSPLISHQYTSQQSSSSGGGGSSSGSQSPNLRHFRSTNIHCQPLNHHQPHPLSRLHPPPPPPPPPPPSSHLESPEANLHNQMRSMAQNMAAQQPIHALPQMPYEHPKQQSPPQHHQLNPQHYHPMQPIRSLSLSCHPLTTNYSLTSSSPPNSNTSPYQQQQQQPMSANNRCNTQSPDKLLQPQQPMAANYIPHAQLIRLGAMASNPPSANNCSPFVARDRVTPISPSSCSPTQPLASSSSTTTTSTPSMHNKINQTTATTTTTTTTATSNTTVSPITRQHSLVSKYNCKPCGIVFSQPETLRAHQESYCTKRDRAQSQIRSQSAVSAAAVQQGKGDSAGGK